MTIYSEFKLAAIQAAPVVFDREASMKKACRLIQEAGARGAMIAAFGKTWLPGYPHFIWGSSSDSLLPYKAAAEYLANAVEIPSRTTDQLCEAARQANVDVVIGVVERDTRTQGTAYCTLLFIANDGRILGRHRKLKPTHKERAAWGEGDGASLTVYERPYGRVSSLSCWEHNMVLPGYVLMSQGTQIHIAAWPGYEREAPPAETLWPRQLLLSRAFASQAAAYVILAGGLASPEHVPDAYQELMAPAHTGDSCIIDPRGEVIAGPAEGETILIADGSREHIFAAKSACDVAGHYSRPDIFQLRVNRTPHRRVVEMQEQEYEAVEPEAAPEE